MRVDRFVFDNNIWVSYLISGSEQKLIDIIADNDLTVFSCDELLTEIRRRFDITYPIKRYIPLDPDDDYLIALALQTSSGFITSGDSDILSEKVNLERKFKKLKILTKAEFERMFSTPH